MQKAINPPLFLHKIHDCVSSMTKAHCIVATYWQDNTQSDMIQDIQIHLHADAAHHLMCGGQVAVSGESSSMAWFQIDVKQIADVPWKAWKAFKRYNKYTL